MSVRISLALREKKIENNVQSAYKNFEMWQEKGLRQHACAELKEKSRMSILALEITLQCMEALICPDIFWQSFM